MIEINKRTPSPERSKSIKIKIPNKMFPEDFFRRSASQSPHRNSSPSKLSPPLRKKISLEDKKNQLYWEIMREQLEKSKPNTKKSVVRPIQRIWVYSEKKCRQKVYREEANGRTRQKMSGVEKRKIKEQNEEKMNENYLPDGLFTFYGRNSTKGMSINLPSIK